MHVRWAPLWALVSLSAAACSDSRDGSLHYIDAAVDAEVDAALPDMAAPDMAADEDGGEADGSESDAGDAGE